MLQQLPNKAMSAGIGMMSNLPPDIVNKVIKTVTKTVSDTVSMQAQEAIGQGVPWGHVLGELMKMAPPEAQAMAAQGSGGNGNQPPGGGMAKREDSMQAPQQPNQLNPGQLQNSPYQQPAQNLNQMLVPGGQQQGFQIPQVMPAKGAMQGASIDPNGNVYQQGFGNEMLSRLLPGLIPGQSTNQAINQQGAMTDIAAKRQKLAGQEPLQSGDREKLGIETEREMLKLKATLDAKGYEGLASEQATKFGLLMEGRDAVVEIDNLVGTGDIGKIAAGQKFTADFFKSPAQRELQLALETAIDTRTRVETGAALQPEELKRETRKLMPRIGEDKKTWRKRLGRSFDFFNRSIAVADPQGIHQQRAGNARQTFANNQGGDIRQQAIQELMRRRSQKNA